MTMRGRSSVPAGPERIEVRTRWTMVAIRVVFGVALLAVVPISWALGRTDRESLFGSLLCALAGLFSLCYRVRERAVLDPRGIRLTYAPFSLGPFSIVTREVSVPWGYVRAGG